jgi:DNA-directed RNA polymerase specialized sigma24 family protein
MGSNLNQGKYRNTISLVISKFGGSQDKEDLEQEAELALFSAKKELESHEFPDKLAYKIIKSRVIDYLRKVPPKAEDISDPVVVKRYDKQNVIQPNIDVLLDTEKAVHLVNCLPEPYKLIIQSTFGIGDNLQLTEKDLAYLLQKSPDWVNRKKNQALLKLKAIMERKN